jgi:hypothetical protein
MWRIKMVSLYSLLHATALCAMSDKTEVEMDIIDGLDERAIAQINLEAAAFHPWHLED